MRNQRRGSFQMELIRKAAHILTGIGIIVGVHTGLLDVTLLGLLIVLFISIILYNLKYEEELLTRLLTVNRADAKVPGLDILSFLTGCWVVLVLFDQYIAFAAIMVLTFGDSVAHLIGSRFGGTMAALSKNAYIEGTIAGTVMATLAAWIYVDFIPAFLSAAIAMFVEAGELRVADHHIDDNLVIPLVAGTVLWVIQLAITA